ncbi:MAG TPA: 16S rRNA (cytosine(1402)-N(4))-methyltransferase RsmH [Acidimicrobiia bacterium]|nr:16S rRNA (cytosine(1402)-N(4))-methyltransferase RsmH [Acidimicrobiia bacterium]
MDQDPKRKYHEPVMTREIVELFENVDGGVLVDATYGGGGHSRALLSAYPDLQIIGIDRDDAAVARPAPDRVRLHQRSFSELGELLDELAVGSIDGALFDLGVSGHQLDTAERGFSYRDPGPLDMRMGPDAPRTAADIVNEWSQDDLRRIIAKYGEERFAGRIAAAIVANRPIADTAQLAEVTRNAIPAATRRTGGHPARRTFQAIRIAVNDELGEIQTALETALDRLAPGGRCVVISYHSLEDRIVKRTFADLAQGCICPPEIPECRCDRSPEVRLLTRKPISPTVAEVNANPRARSAKVRAAEKVAA